jgi:DNA-binding NarL/FixJ family response regulator
MKVLIADVVLTGAADAAAARAAMEAGADDVLRKPLDAADLACKLIAAELVTAMHRRLHADARHDPLTGIGNRLRLAEDLPSAGGSSATGHAYCVAIADDDESVRLTLRAMPDMPGGGGIRAAAEIREACPTAQILALSADSSPAAQLDTSRAGAVGYLVKGAPPDEIERAIRSAAPW